MRGGLCISTLRFANCLEPCLVVKRGEDPQLATADCCGPKSSPVHLRRRLLGWVDCGVNRECENQCKARNG